MQLRIANHGKSVSGDFPLLGRTDMLYVQSVSTAILAILLPKLDSCLSIIKLLIQNAWIVSRLHITATCLFLVGNC